MAIANPKTAPYGKATFEALTHTKLWDKNIKKFVYAENISQTVQYSMVATDIGFIAKASLYSPKMLKYKFEFFSTAHVWSTFEVGNYKIKKSFFSQKCMAFVLCHP